MTAKATRLAERRRKEQQMRHYSKQSKPKPNGSSKRRDLAKRHRQARAQPLPGMENVRIKPLDDICSSISETRSQMNELRQEEKDLEKKALALLQQHGKTAWQFAGVELLRVPTEEKLRVRLTKVAATTEVDDDEQQADKQADEVRPGVSAEWSE